MKTPLRRLRGGNPNRLPKLSADVWRWLDGGMLPLPEEQRGGSTSWDIYLLPDVGTRGWKYKAEERIGNYQPDTHTPLFWRALKEKVLAGNIEVVEGYLHKHDDRPLLTQAEAEQLVKESR